MRRPIAVLLPAFAALLAVIACGDGGGSSPSPSQDEIKLAVVPASLTDFLAQFSDVVIMQENCAYDQASGLVDCAARGLYQLKDGIQGADAVCRVMLVNDQPVGINCQTQDPLGAITYAIQPAPTSTPAP